MRTLLVILFATILATVSAQQPPVRGSITAMPGIISGWVIGTQTVPGTEKVPQVPEPVKRAVLERQAQINALEYAKSVLQKEFDAVAAQLQRDIDQLQRQAPAGYELRGDLTYAKKTEPKKE